MEQFKISRLKGLLVAQVVKNLPASSKRGSILVEELEKMVTH